MKWLAWFPWRFVVSRMARSHGFIDPVAIYSKLRQFAQPSEIAEPIELMRAGLIMQARGLINTHAIQHNLDWVWPYWISRQFNPRDDSFVPRAFSPTHVNLTHRNWTAVGMPDCAQMPLVDPRGLVTPLFDGWSIDVWTVPEDGAPLLPSRASNVAQRMVEGDDVVVETRAAGADSSITTRAEVVYEDGVPACRVGISGATEGATWLVVALRPANPEGVSFINRIEMDGRSQERATLTVNGDATVQLDGAPERVCMSTYRQGDVLRSLPDGAETDSVECDIGLATAAAMYRLGAGESRRVAVTVPLTGLTAHPEPSATRRRAARPVAREPVLWSEALADTCTMEVPDERIAFLFRNAVRNLVLFSPDEVYPGPYTSKRFWFRDAAFILNAMMTVGLMERAARVVEQYPARQQRDGFFRSQEGEWDANGQALWTLDRYRRLTGEPLSETLVRSVRRGVQWIARKRTDDGGSEPHAGLLPAGFSAEHLGPNDYFYWDDFWSVAGLRAAGEMLQAAGDAEGASEAAGEATMLAAAIDRSLEATSAHRRHAGVPASPYRRMDAGAIGSLAGSYPTQVWGPRDPRMLATAEFLFDRCTVHDGFFQDVIHSGINAYLTLHLAQVFLRAGDPRHVHPVRALAELASPTGNWPEAIHPNTGGGCMGDGQHIWAAAEWVLLLRNWFVREEGLGLVVGSGIPDDWLVGTKPLRFGPTVTPFGVVRVVITPSDDAIEVSWEAQWRGDPPPIEVRLGGVKQSVGAEQSAARIPRAQLSLALQEAGP